MNRFTLKKIKQILQTLTPFAINDCDILCLDKYILDFVIFFYLTIVKDKCLLYKQNDLL